jgi:hypothetical protein
MAEALLNPPRRIASDSELLLSEGGHTLRFSFEDLLRYHGPGSSGGVAHAFKVMELALPALAGGGGPLPRRELAITTAFPGPGARDAFEMLTRCVSDGRYAVDTELPAAADAPPSATGHYFFRVSLADANVDLAIREGQVREEFIALSRLRERSEEQETRLTELKWEMTERLMAMPADEVYRIVGHS